MFFKIFDNWITEKSLEIPAFCARRCGKCRIIQTKTKKGREFGKIIFFVKNFGEFRKKIICNIWRHNCVFVCLKSLPFSFLHKKFYFSRIGRRWLRQAVCKTVAVYAPKVQIFPDAVRFWIWDLGLRIYFNPKSAVPNHKSKRGRNSNGWVAVFQTECCGFKSRRSLQYLISDSKFQIPD